MVLYAVRGAELAYGAVDYAECRAALGLWKGTNRLWPYAHSLAFYASYALSRAERIGRAWRRERGREGGSCLLYTSPSPRDRG
eukprot:2881130-Rhodomonas_salina.1